MRKKKALSQTFAVLASVIGAPVNPAKIVNTFKSSGYGDITPETVDHFIEYFQDAFVVKRVEKYNVKGRKYIGSSCKIYFEDIGIRNAALSFRQIEETHIIENILYNELYYRRFSVDVCEVNISESTGRRDKNGNIIY